MKKRIAIAMLLTLVILLMLLACGGEGDGAPEDSPVATEVAASEEAETPPETEAPAAIPEDETPEEAAPEAVGEAPAEAAPDSADEAALAEESENGADGFMIMPSQPLSDGEWEQEGFLPGGAYFSRYALFDEPVYYECFRLYPGYWFEMESIEDWLVNTVVLVYEPNAYDLTITEDEVMSARLTYPSFQVRFTTGTNEDTCFYVGRLVTTDSWTFWVNCWAYADYFDGNLRTVENWLDSTGFVEGDSLEGLGSLSPQLVAQDGEQGFASDAGINVDSAMIRIMRSAYPEYGMSAEERTGMAYSYDGFGDVGNEAVMLFSYGDLPNPAALPYGQYAVNSRGKLYFYLDESGEYDSFD